MSLMTVRELIEALEELPAEYPVITEGAEITEVLVREEMYLTSEHQYDDGPVIKLY